MSRKEIFHFRKIFSQTFNGNSNWDRDTKRQGNRCLFYKAVTLLENTKSGTYSKIFTVSNSSITQIGYISDFRFHSNLSTPYSLQVYLFSLHFIRDWRMGKHILLLNNFLFVYCCLFMVSRTLVACGNYYIIVWWPWQLQH